MTIEISEIRETPSTMMAEVFEDGIMIGHIRSCEDGWYVAVRDLPSLPPFPSLDDAMAYVTEDRLTRARQGLH